MSTLRRVIFGKLNPTLFRAVESATAFAKLRGNPHVELTHWFHQLCQLDDGDIHRICAHYRIDRGVVHRNLAAALSRLPAGASSLQDFSQHVMTAIERSWIVASLEFGDGGIRGAWLLLAVLRDAELRQLLFDMVPAFRRIPVDALADMLPSIVAESPEHGERPHRSHDSSGGPLLVPGDSVQMLAESRDEESPLNRFCIDLTAQALLGKIDPVIGRDQEIRTLVDILLRRRQNNPLLTGDAGVGKTALVEGLARAIVSGGVPPALHQVRLLSLDVGALTKAARAGSSASSSSTFCPCCPAIGWTRSRRSARCPGCSWTSCRRMQTKLTQKEGASLATLNTHDPFIADAVRVVGGGSYRRWSKESIEDGTAGNYVNHATGHGFVGPKSLPVPDFSIPTASGFCRECMLRALAAGSAFAIP